MTNEPDWIEHDGSAVCPVPAGHNVEVRFRDGTACSEPDIAQHWYWRHDGGKADITHYRDWTVFEQQAAGKDDVAGFPIGALVEKISGPEWRGKVVGHYSSTFTPNGIVIECIADGAKGQVHVEPAKRMRLVEPAPVEPLREALSWAIGQHFDLTDAQLADIVDEARAKGVTTNTAPEADERN